MWYNTIFIKSWRIIITSYNNIKIENNIDDDSMSVLCENLQYLDKLTILSLYRIYNWL